MDLTQEQTHGLHYLAETRDGLVTAVNGLDESQASFKPAPDRWSIAGVVEHLGTIETTISTSLPGRLLTSAAPPVDRNMKESDALLMSQLVARASRIQAPEMFHPTGQTLQKGLERFLEGREKIAAFLQSNPDLRKYSQPHPALGLLDGYQWMLAVAGHSARHTLQILEIKSDPNFPAHS